MLTSSPRRSDCVNVVEWQAPCRRPVAGSGTCEVAVLTIMFTDIVNSTQTIERLGDAAWSNLLSRHDAIFRRTLARFGGHEVESTGDGFFSVFDSPMTGIRCALAVRSALRGLDIDIRCGLHRSECLTVCGHVRGLGVHMAARVASAAQPNQILISCAVREVLVGELSLGHGHRHALRGLSGEHELFEVRGFVQGERQAGSTRREPARPPGRVEPAYPVDASGQWS